jgi:IstB-like ATP binding protein
MGPVGVGKTFMASALGHIACRRRHTTLMARADQLLKRLRAFRLDGNHDTELRRLIRLELLILDDFCLQALDETDTADIYELIVERHRRASTIVTTNREPPGEWLAAMADPLLAEAAIDRLTSNAYQLVVDGPSYRQRQRPGSERQPGPPGGGPPHHPERPRPPPASRPSPPGGLRPALTPAQPHPERGALDPLAHPIDHHQRARSWTTRWSHARGKHVVPSRWQATSGHSRASNRPTATQPAATSTPHPEPSCAGTPRRDSNPCRHLERAQASPHGGAWSP